MKGVQLQFSPEFIRQALQIDDQYDIIGATYNTADRFVTFIVTGPELPEVQEGLSYPHGHLDDPVAPKQRRHIIPD